MPESKALKLNEAKTIHYWALFDWANSSFSLVIAAAIFPAFYAGVTDDVISIGSWSLANTTIYAWAITIAYIFLVVVTPLISGIADVGGRRKYFLRLFMLLGGISCMGLFFFDEAAEWQLGTILYILATIGFTGGLVFYNAFLPLISTEDKMDIVSARGYAYGYVGSVILLLFNLLLITFPDFFYLPSSEFAIRLSFVMVGIWWIGFGTLSLNKLPKDSRKKATLREYIHSGLNEVKAVYKELQSHKTVMYFLASFFFYSAGVRTIIYLAPTFAEEELSFTTNELILTILILQMVALVGAYLFAYISRIWGNKTSLMIMLVIWLIICSCGYYVYTKFLFYILAAGVGLVMGGIQSISRSTYAKYVKEGTKEIATYFSLFDILEKIAIIAGTFIFGLVDQLTGGMRNSLLSLVFFFVIGIILLCFTRIEPLKLKLDAEQ